MGLILVSLLFPSGTYLFLPTDIWQELPTASSDHPDLLSEHHSQKTAQYLCLNVTLPRP